MFRYCIVYETSSKTFLLSQYKTSHKAKRSVIVIYNTCSD